MASGVGKVEKTTLRHRVAGAPPRVGDQLELELAGPGRAWVEPWGGAAPRGLTKAFEKFSFGAPPTGGLRGNAQTCSDEERPQLEIQLGLPFEKES